MMKKVIFILFCFAYLQAQVPVDFVRVLDIDSNIRICPRYAMRENFTAGVVTGYQKADLVLTQQAATALLAVEQEVLKDGYTLVVYDAYRPQRAVQNFVDWSYTQDTTGKAYYYPNLPKASLFKKGYVAFKSGHSRGSTLDLTLMRLEDTLQCLPSVQKRKLTNGKTFYYLQDGTLDMGSHWDMLHEVSHTESDLVDKQFLQHRLYLREKMRQFGFRPIAIEWWHFTLQNEPFPDTYFDFVVE
jgi:D-alanyl-D-alanine dipeptidase